MNPRLLAWGANVAAVRAALGMSQTAFAKEIGTSQGVLSSWENGRVGPNWRSMRRIVAIDPSHRTQEELFPDDVEVAP